MLHSAYMHVRQFAISVTRAPRRMVREALLPQTQDPALVPSFFDYVRMRSVPFGLWVHNRWRYFRLKELLQRSTQALRRIQSGTIEGDRFLKEKVLNYNADKVGIVRRRRTERLMNILRTVGDLDTRRAKVLCIGPRNEAEVLLLSLYGFPLRNITSIDLFSYSPIITVMDMHDLKFPDNTFDIVYSSYVIRYSNDAARAVAESVRVLKPGGLMAIAFVYGGPAEKWEGTRLENGLTDLYGYFGRHVREVLWREEVMIEPGSTTATTIFKIVK